MHIHEHVCLDCGSRFYPRAANTGHHPPPQCTACGGANTYRSLSLIPMFYDWSAAGTPPKSYPPRPDGEA
jgi:hypothetical protein